MLSSAASGKQTADYERCYAHHTPHHAHSNETFLDDCIIHLLQVHRSCMSGRTKALQITRAFSTLCAKAPLISRHTSAAMYLALNVGTCLFQAHGLMAVRCNFEQFFQLLLCLRIFPASA